MSELRIAVAGLGHGKGFLGLIEAEPRTRLVALVDRDRDKGEAATAEQGVPCLPSVEELIAAGIADAVILALPTPVHAEAAVACLEGGLHVLLEKPLCRTMDEAVAIGRAVTASGRHFQLGVEVRSSDLHRSIMSDISAGALGTVTNVWYNQHCCDKHASAWRHRRSDMGGKFFDCGVHYFDLMQQWAGAPAARVCVFGHELGETGASAEDPPESAVVIFEYANGVRGTYNFGAVNTFNDDASFGVAGTTGRIMGNPWLPEKAGSYELRTDRGRKKAHVVFDGALCSTGHLGFKEQFAAFVDGIIEGGPNPCPFEDALATQRLLHAIDRSLATGAVVEVRPS